MGERLRTCAGLRTHAGVGTRGMVGAWLGDGTNSALGRGSGRDRRSGQMVHLEVGTISASGLESGQSVPLVWDAWRALRCGVGRAGGALD